MWFRMETRVVKNVCAPAVVLGDQIIIVGGKGSVSPSLSLPLLRSCRFSHSSCLGCSLKKHLDLGKERRSLPTLHTLFLWRLMVIEVEISSPWGTFLLQVAGPGWRRLRKSQCKLLLCRREEAKSMGGVLYLLCWLTAWSSLSAPLGRMESMVTTRPWMACQDGWATGLWGVGWSFSCLLGVIVTYPRRSVKHLERGNFCVFFNLRTSLCPWQVGLSCHW